MSLFKNFFERFPAPTSSVARITVAELAELMTSDRVAGRDYVVVDVRRMDLEVRPGQACVSRADGLGRRRCTMFILRPSISPRRAFIRHCRQRDGCYPRKSSTRPYARG